MAWNVLSVVGWPRIRYPCWLALETRSRRAGATQNDRGRECVRMRIEDAKIRGGKVGGKGGETYTKRRRSSAAARFELRQRREVTLTSISVRLRGARRCLRYIRKRLASVRHRRNKSNTTGSRRRKGSRYVSYRTLLHLRKCTNQTDDAGQCTVVIPSRRRAAVSASSSSSSSFSFSSSNRIETTDFIVSLSLAIP